MCRHIRDKCDADDREAIRKGKKTINQVYEASRLGLRKEEATYEKQEARQGTRAELPSDPTLGVMNEWDQRDRVTTLLVDLLPQLMRMTSVMRDVRSTIESFCAQGGNINGLAGRPRGSHFREGRAHRRTSFNPRI
jgi:hypothetical protein